MQPESVRRFADPTTAPHVMTLVMMSAMSAMAMNMFLPSLPSMTAYFQTEYRLMQLSVALFLGVNAVLQVVIGPISDRYGRRPVLLAGFVIFLASTIGCLYATTAEMFLAFRMGQATIVVSMVLSRAIIRDLYDQDQAASMLGYVTMGMAVVPMLTPAIGGYLDEHFGWHANFWVFLAAGSAVTFLIWLDCGETNHQKSQSFAAQLRDWPELLMSPRFWGYALAAAFSSGAFFAYLGGAPFVGSEVFDLSPTHLGLLFGAPAIGYIAGNGITGRVARRHGIDRMILIGATIAWAGVTLSLILFKLGYGTAISFFGLMIFVGLGNGLTLPSANVGAMSVRPELAGSASGLSGALTVGAGAIVTSLTGWLLTEDNGAWALVAILLVTALIGLTAAILTRRLEFALAAQDV